MCRQAVIGFFQYAFCKILDSESPARALVSAPPDLKEWSENACGSPAPSVYFFIAAGIFAVVTGIEPLLGSPSVPTENAQEQLT